MTNLEIFFLMLLISENLLLLSGWWLWQHRHCVKCKQVKSLDQVFNKLCANCQPKPKKEELDKDNVEIF